MRFTGILSAPSQCTYFRNNSSNGKRQNVWMNEESGKYQQNMFIVIGALMGIVAGLDGKSLQQWKEIQNRMCTCMNIVDVGLDVFATQISNDTRFKYSAAGTVRLHTRTSYSANYICGCFGISVYCFTSFHLPSSTLLSVLHSFLSRNDHESWCARIKSIRFLHLRIKKKILEPKSDNIT